jgi:nucleoside diphosphate kinase
MLPFDLPDPPQMGPDGSLVGLDQIQAYAQLHQPNGKPFIRPIDVVIVVAGLVLLAVILAHRVIRKIRKLVARIRARRAARRAA